MHTKFKVLPTCDSKVIFQARTKRCEKWQSKVSNSMTAWGGVMILANFTPYYCNKHKRKVSSQSDMRWQSYFPGKDLDATNMPARLEVQTDVYTQWMIPQYVRSSASEKKKFLWSMPEYRYLILHCLLYIWVLSKGETEFNNISFLQSCTPSRNKDT